MPRQTGSAGRERTPLDRTIPPDAVLLHRELRWTVGTVLAVSAIGYALAGGHGAMIGTGTGYLVQQAAYRLIVRTLWHGWQTRSMTLEGRNRAQEIGHISLRAFTLWIRRATSNDRLYVALWNFGAGNDDDDEETEIEDSIAEIRIRNAYSAALTLNNVPLRCDNTHRRRLRRTLQRDEKRLLHLATGQRLDR